MTYQANYTLPDELLEQIAQDGFAALPELLRVVICFCQPKREPFDHRKGSHLGHRAGIVIIEKGAI